MVRRAENLQGVLLFLKCDSWDKRCKSPPFNMHRPKGTKRYSPTEWGATTTSDPIDTTGTFPQVSLLVMHPHFRVYNIQLDIIMSSNPTTELN